MPVEQSLADLAAAYGVATEYWDQKRQRHLVPEATIRAILAAFEVDASSESACRVALRATTRAHWESVLPPVLVLRKGSDVDQPWESWVHVPQGAAVRVWVELEDGGRRFDVSQPRRRGQYNLAQGVRIDEYVTTLPRDIPLGWHRLVAETGGSEHSCPLVVCPARLEPRHHASKRRAWGIAAQLYSIRSSRSWGIGDLTDLDDLAAWSGRDLGADFLLVNPLHASAPVADQVPSPYLPTTRRYSNPLYIRVEAITEFAYLSQEDRTAVGRLAGPLLLADHSAELLDRSATWLAKREALLLVHAVPRSIGRQAQYRQYLNAEGRDLRQFALWCALAEQFGPYWNLWPTELQDPGSTQVADQERRLAERVEFYQWTQWIVDQQLSATQQTAIGSGMSIGVMHDLAVGVDRFGADTWASRELYAADVTVGAPPDSFNQIGQDWSQPPMRPDRLAAAGYAPFADMLRTLVRHSGGLRIDHILGMFRLWWIPAGMAPSAGTYVRYDHEALTNILLLEAHRAGALIVGEDLGTVEPWVGDFLTKRGILGTNVLWFERDESGPRQPEQWRSNAMAAVTIHDLPPTSGYIEGSHVRLRADLGLLSRPESEEARAHALEMDQWRKLLVQLGFAAEGMTNAQMVVALHRLAAWSPARLLAVSLPDLVGDVVTQNQPGTNDEYPNWRIPLCGADGKPVLLEDLPSRPELAAIVAAIGGPSNYRPA